jgi:hypothetical protein
MLLIYTVPILAWWPTVPVPKVSPVRSKGTPVETFFDLHCNWHYDGGCLHRLSGSGPRFLLLNGQSGVGHRNMHHGPADHIWGLGLVQLLVVDTADM